MSPMSGGTMNSMAFGGGNSRQAARAMVNSGGSRQSNRFSMSGISSQSGTFSKSRGGRAGSTSKLSRMLGGNMVNSAAEIHNPHSYNKMTSSVLSGGNPGSQNGQMQTEM